MNLWIRMLFFYMWIPMVYASCYGKFFNPLIDICWSCIFPISIGSVSLQKGPLPDTPNPSSLFCICKHPLRLGLSVGYWEPIGLVDVTRTPFCFVNLGGLQLLPNDHYPQGKVETANPNQNSSFYYVHWYNFSFLFWFHKIIDMGCITEEEPNIFYTTELDPIWKNDELTVLFYPEIILFAHKSAQSMCAQDSVQALSSLSIDRLFWCAGSQGNMYPLNGYVQEHVGGVQASLLLTERMTYILHKLRLLKDSRGAEANPMRGDLCYSYFNSLLPKSRYRYQMTYPTGGKIISEDTCIPFGRSTAVWSKGRESPYKGEDFGYVVWRKRNCCAL